jgi:hypothetical protein
MSIRALCVVATVTAGATIVGSAQQQTAERPKGRTSATGYSDTPVLPGQKWKVHDIDRPRPKVITPGAQPGMPPSDAIVLFDGRDLSHWLTSRRGSAPGPAKWMVKDGYMEAPHDAGSIFTREKFGDMQLHIEWAAPAEVDGTSQWRGNSGVLLMNQYEIQVLDSYNNPTYADGQAGAIYGQWPPLVNASRRPGEWQSYDIVFIAPKWEGDKLLQKARVTVFHNGVLVQHDKEIIGRMAHRVVGTYAPHGPEEPLGLQDHDTATRYRNIWVRRLADYDQPGK